MFWDFLSVKTMWRAERPRSPRAARTNKTDKRKHTFHDLSRLKANEEELTILLDEVTKSSDRSACIIQSAVVERDVETAIVLRLARGDDQSVKPLFEQGGALSTFFAKIHLGYAMDLFDDAVRDDLETIRRVRNVFAHSSLPITFATEEVTKQLRNLRFTEYSDIYNAPYFDGFAEDKRKFSACCLAVIVVLNRSIEEHVDELQQALKLEISRNMIFKVKSIPALIASFLRKSGKREQGSE